MPSLPASECRYCFVLRNEKFVVPICMCNKHNPKHLNAQTQCARYMFTAESTDLIA